MPIASRRSGLWLAAAGVIGLVAAVLTLGASGERPPDGSIVVARSPLSPGTLIDDQAAAALLVTVRVPASLVLNGVFSDPSRALGRRVAVPVGAGEPLSQAALGGEPGAGPAPLAVGERAVAVPLSAAGGAGAGLAAGARVDVVASTGEGLAGSTALVMGDAEVLSVIEPPSSDGLESPGQALLRVSSAQALRITAALNFAREVRLLVRPLDEVGQPAGPRAVGAP
jgi:Flp pilus assembly protein CpaB